MSPAECVGGPHASAQDTEDGHSAVLDTSEACCEYDTAEVASGRGSGRPAVMRQ